VFSFDALISSIILLIFISLIIYEFAYSAERVQNMLEKNEKTAFAITLSDSLIKNRNSEEPEKGCAEYNSKTRRVQSNAIDKNLLEKIKPTKFGKYELSAIYTKTKNNKKYFFNSNGKNCITIERLVSINKKNSVLGVVVCEK